MAPAANGRLLSSGTITNANVAVMTISTVSNVVARRSDLIRPLHCELTILQLSGPMGQRVDARTEERGRARAA